MRNPTKFDAVRTLVDGDFSGNDDATNLIFEEGEKVPTTAEIDVRYKELTDAHTALEYARKRQAEYPSYATQFDILYHSGVAGLKAELKKTKDKFPK